MVIVVAVIYLVVFGYPLPCKHSETTNMVSSGTVSLCLSKASVSGVVK